MKRRSLQLFTLLLGAGLSLTACSSYEYPTFGKPEDGSKYNVGILLPVEHDALNAAKAGFIEGLEEGGWKDGSNITLSVRNALGNPDTQRTLAKTLMDNCVLTLGLGTGATADLKSAQKIKGSKNPILFSAVTDPVGEGFVKSLTSPGGYVTGASDAQPVEAQIDLIKECCPNVDKVGIFYTQSETNSRAQAIQAKAQLDKIGGITTIIKTCSDATDVATSITALAGTEGLDAIYIPTDNNVAANMALVKRAVSGTGILVIGGEEGIVKNGGGITLSINYKNLGKRTGELAVKILNGEAKPADLPVVTMSASDCEYVMQSANLADAGVTLPESVLSKCRDVADTPAA